MTHTKSSMTLFMQILGGICIAAGSITAMVLTGNDFAELGKLQGVLGWFIFLTTLILGFLCFGLAHAIQILHYFYKKEEEKEFSITESNIYSTVALKTHPIQEGQKKEILNFFTNKEVKDIQGTHLEDFFKVVTTNETLFVELGDFQPKIISSKRATKLGLLS